MCVCVYIFWSTLTTIEGVRVDVVTTVQFFPSSLQFFFFFFSLFDALILGPDL